jgi:multimeric flavodoxin WrbA
MGYTNKLLSETLKGVLNYQSKYGYVFSIELYSVEGKNHKPCTGCRVCQRSRKCVMQDDMQILHGKMLLSDGIIIGSPVYFYDVNAQCKIIIDRSFAIEPLNGNKAGAIITTASSMGTSNAVSTLNMFFSIHGITSAGWLSAYSKADEGEAAMLSAFELGGKVAQIAEEKRHLDSHAFDSFRHIAYGTHSL